MGVGGQRQVPTALLPGNTQYPLYSRLGGPQAGQVPIGARTKYKDDRKAFSDVRKHEINTQYKKKDGDSNAYDTNTVRGRRRGPASGEPAVRNCT